MVVGGLGKTLILECRLDDRRVDRLRVADGLDGRVARPAEPAAPQYSLAVRRQAWPVVVAVRAAAQVAAESGGEHRFPRAPRVRLHTHVHTTTRVSCPLLSFPETRPGRLYVCSSS